MSRETFVQQPSKAFEPQPNGTFTASVSKTPFLSGRSSRRARKRKNYWKNSVAVKRGKGPPDRRSPWRRRALSQEKGPERQIPRTRIYIELEELSSKQKKAIIGLLKDMGFISEEVMELVVRMPEAADMGSE